MRDFKMGKLAGIATLALITGLSTTAAQAQETPAACSRNEPPMSQTATDAASLPSAVMGLVQP